MLGEAYRKRIRPLSVENLVVPPLGDQYRAQVQAGLGAAPAQKKLRTNNEEILEQDPFVPAGEPESDAQEESEPEDLEDVEFSLLER